jgi:hypothetical protein
MKNIFIAVSLFSLFMASPGFSKVGIGMNVLKVQNNLYVASIPFLFNNKFRIEPSMGYSNDNSRPHTVNSQDVFVGISFDHISNLTDQLSISKGLEFSSFSTEYDYNTSYYNLYYLYGVEKHFHCTGVCLSIGIGGEVNFFKRLNIEIKPSLKTVYDSNGLHLSLSNKLMIRIYFKD